MSELELRAYAVLLERVKSERSRTAIVDSPVVQRLLAQLQRRDVLPRTGEG